MEWIGEATVGLFPRFPSLSLGQVLTMDEERRQEVGRNGIKDLTPSLSHPFPPFTSYLLGSVLNSERSG